MVQVSKDENKPCPFLRKPALLSTPALLQEKSEPPTPTKEN